MQARIRLGIDEATKQRIALAAWLRDQSVSEFVLKNAVREAKAAIAAEDTATRP